MRRGLAVLITMLLLFTGGLGGTTLPGVLAVDLPPEIFGSDIVIMQGDPNPIDVMAGITATDDLDGDITHLVIYDGEPIDKNTVGLYCMFYYVEDSSSQYGELFRFAVVVPDSNPFIWPPEIYIELGQEFDPFNYIRAYDLEDKDISASLEVLENTVDTDAIGAYEVTVKATDSNANSTTLTIPVFVEDFGNPENEPEIHADTMILKVGDLYDPLAGVTATDKTDGDITHLIQVEFDEVRTDAPGMYWTYYSVENSLGVIGGNGRKVVVLADSNPVIFSAEQWELGIGEDFEGFIRMSEAFDYEDGDISDLVHVESHNIDFDVAGEYELTLMVEDSDHNQARFTVKVIIIDYTYPTLDAYGGVLFLGQDFNPMNYVSAWDREDGDLTDQVVVVQNNVNTQIEGSYEVIYSVTNSAGKTTTKTAVFEVVRMPEFRIFIIFNGHSYEIEANLFEGTMFFTSPVHIPAGSLVGIEIYMEGNMMVN